VAARLAAGLRWHERRFEEGRERWLYGVCRRAFSSALGAGEISRVERRPSRRHSLLSLLTVRAFLRRRIAIP